MQFYVYNFMKRDILGAEGVKELTDKNITKYIARRIKYYREQKGLTQKELGGMVGIKHNTISSYENATNRPDMDILFKIAKALDISINDLFPPTQEYSSIVKENPAIYNVSNIGMIPVVGHISCGNGSIAYENIEGYELVPKEWIKGGKYFCLRAKGDSMIGARIHEGDLLLIREQPEVENGEIAAVLIGDEAVLKRVFYHNGQLVLQSENPKYPPVVAPPAEVKIIGKLKKIIISM